ncbi:MAG: hypothetical protein R3F62_02285 [Planctomycetota bacterium]
MSEPRPSERGATARLNSLRFEPVRSSGRLDAAPSARLRGRPSHETQRLTPLQADLLGEVRTVRGRSARIGARLPQQERAGDGLAVARARSRSVSVRLVAAVSARLAHPLQSVTREERFLARWTLALSAVSAPLAMLAFTVLVGLDLPRRRGAAEGAAAQVAARDAIEPLLTEPRAAAVAAPVEGARPLSEAPSPTLRPAAPRDLARAPGGGALAAAARRDRAREGTSPSAAPRGSGARRRGPGAGRGPGRVRGLGRHPGGDRRRRPAPAAPAPGPRPRVA